MNQTPWKARFPGWEWAIRMVSLCIPDKEVLVYFSHIEGDWTTDRGVIITEFLRNSVNYYGKCVDR